MSDAWVQNLRLLRRMNWLMLLAVLLLAVVGILFVYSACSMREDVVRTLYRKQMGWAVAGLACYFATALYDYRRLRDGAGLLYGVALVLLVVVLL